MKKKNLPKTHIVIVLDKSWSMGGGDSEAAKAKRQATLNDYNEKVSMYQAEAEKGEQEILVSLVTFNQEVEEHLWEQAATEIQTAEEEHYVPDGGTAWRDAIGHCILKANETIVPHLGEKDAVLLIVISDGEENSSQHVSEERLANLCDEFQKTGKCTITYMGANQDVKKIAKKLHIPVANCAVWSNKNSRSYDHAYGSHNARMARYLSARSAVPSVTSCSDFCSDDASVADYTDVGDVPPVTAKDAKSESVVRKSATNSSWIASKTG